MEAPVSNIQIQNPFKVRTFWCWHLIGSWKPNQYMGIHKATICWDLEWLGCSVLEYHSKSELFTSEQLLTIYNLYSSPHWWSPHCTSFLIISPYPEIHFWGQRRKPPESYVPCHTRKTEKIIKYQTIWLIGLDYLFMLQLPNTLYSLLIRVLKQTSIMISLSSVVAILWSGVHFHFSSKPLHFTLKDSNEQFSQPSGILPFKIDNLFTKILSPTFLLVFRTEKVVCRDVEIWFKLSSVQSIEWMVVLYSLKSCIASLYCKWIWQSSFVHCVNLIEINHFIRVELRTRNR